MSTRSDSEQIGDRKAKHLEICVRADRYQVETGESYFDELRFLHRSLPELDARDVRTETEFLGYRISMPVFISSMTGGSSEGFRVNKSLARAAQRARVPVGMGSIRVLFRNADVFPHFHLKPMAPDVPVFANIGGVQIRDMDHREVSQTVRRLEVDALVIHLNPGQELFQPEGDSDFRSVLESIARYCGQSEIPVIVKETGFGISPSEARRLLDAGVHYVNVAGAGGTNWMQVEALRLGDAERQMAEAFADWGTPTALLLAAGHHLAPRILASGGVRDGMDVAKCIALGATAAGLALPFARAVYRDGEEGVARVIESLEKVLTTVMTLTGCTTVEQLGSAPLWRSPRFSAELAAYREAEERND